MCFGVQNMGINFSRQSLYKQLLISCLMMGGAASGNCAFAQSTIVPDTTLGAENSTVIPNFNRLPVEVINGGAIRGQNLFHSFLEFNVSQGRGAYFFSPAAIENILARVTGSNRSQILGTLGTFGNSQPNLFLINPNGIIFGPNASLDVGGSFVGTTANAVRLGDTGLFSATEPASSNLLSINPSALFSNAIANQAQIINRSTATTTVLRDPVNGSQNRPINGLNVLDGKSLLLVGNNVSLEGGILQAPGGRIELGGLAESGTVGLQVDGNNLSLSFPDGVVRSNVSLTDFAGVDVQAAGGGSITINARNLDIKDANILAGIKAGLGTPASQAGDIVLNATGNTAIANSFIFNNLESGAVGRGGNVIVNTGSLALTNAAQIGTITRGVGDAGSVIVKANDVVSISDLSAIFSAPFFAENNLFATGNSGGIDIRAKSFFLTGSSQLVASTFSQGNAGKISIQVDDSVEIANSDILSTVDAPTSAASAVGNSGGIEIRANSLLLTDNSQLVASTFSQGDAGKISIQVADSVSLFNSNIFSTVGSPFASSAVGNSNGIDIRARSVLLGEKSQLATSTFGQGNAGNINLSVDNSISFLGGESTVPVFNILFRNPLGIQLPFLTSVADFGNAASTGIFSTVQNGANGNAGNITIQARSLNLNNGAEVQSLTLGNGKAANIEINTSDAINVSGVAPVTSLFSFIEEDFLAGGFSSGFISSTEEGANGQGGNIKVSTGTLRLSEGAVLSARTRSNFQAGDISVNADRLEVTNGGQLLASTFSSGKAGNLTLNITGDVVLSGKDPTFVTRLQQFGPQIVDNDGSNSGLFSRSQTTGDNPGDAGQINLSARRLFVDNQGAIKAATTSGRGGEINLQLKDVLLLRRGSQISTTAGTNDAGGNGGNITINSPFIVAVPSENSDIAANAFTGNGGRVTINTQGIFGIQSRLQPTPLSDITASSTGGGINGVVNINTPDVDVSRGIVNLPTNIVEASNRIIASSCAAFDGKNGSTFLVTGRGGLPPSPDDYLSSDVVWSDTRLTAMTTQQRSSKTTTATPPSKPKAVEIIPAVGWVINDKGEVTLIAQMPSVTYNPWQNSAKCQRANSTSEN
jgi:filamentous hemagglutinin family protein